MSLKIVVQPPADQEMDDRSTETIALSEAHIEYLENMSRESSPLGESDALRAFTHRFGLTVGPGLNTFLLSNAVVVADHGIAGVPESTFKAESSPSVRISRTPFIGPSGTTRET